MSSVVEALKIIDKRAKDRRKFKQVMKQKSDTRELWYNTGLKVKAESGSLLFPLVLKKQVREYGEDWLLSLPAGLSEMDIRRKAHKIAVAHIRPKVSVELRTIQNWTVKHKK